VRNKLLTISLNIAIYSVTVSLLMRMKNAWTWLSGFHLFLLSFLWRRFRIKEIRATIESIEISDDDCYCITWGYINPGPTVKVRQGESCLLVKKGTALILNNNLPDFFEKGHHRVVIQTIVKSGADVEWIIKKQRTSCRAALVDRIASENWMNTVSS